MFDVLKAKVSEDGPRSAAGTEPRARHPLLWCVVLYAGGVLATIAIAAILHILVFSASR